MLMTRTTLFDTAFLESSTGGTAAGAPAGDRVVTDSRTDVTGALFVAIAGPRFDGHDFVESALAGGAGGAVVASSWWESAGDRAKNVLVVPDTLLALQALARTHRDRFGVPLAAVTGSNGKTTTKEFLAAALRPLGTVLKTSGNLNNHIGLPLTLLELAPAHRAAAVEIGINHPGELAHLAGLARPQVGVITNIAEAHLEGLGSLEGVARAKAEMAGSLPADGVLVIPHGCGPLEQALSGYAGRRVTYGRNPESDVHPREVGEHGLAGTTIELSDGTRVKTVHIGEHAIDNVLAALAAAGAMGVSPSEAAPHIAGVAQTAGRLCPHREGGVTLLDDTYNANPTSLGVSLNVLRSQEVPHRWAILGDMLELGPDSETLHREAGAGAAFLDGLITVGPMARELGKGAVATGLDAARVREAPDGATAGEMLADDLSPGDVVLIKGSRGIRLETAVGRLLTRLGGES
jgi:UDP-N-acetylmuramoyl-tripeptide--D-alanyl-D-alanine ligase